MLIVLLILNRKRKIWEQCLFPMMRLWLNTSFPEEEAVCWLNAMLPSPIRVKIWFITSTKFLSMLFKRWLTIWWRVRLMSLCLLSIWPSWTTLATRCSPRRIIPQKNLIRATLPRVCWLITAWSMWWTRWLLLPTTLLSSLLHFIMKMPKWCAPLCALTTPLFRVIVITTPP